MFSVCTLDDVISCFPLSCDVPLRLRAHTHTHTNTVGGSCSKQRRRRVDVWSKAGWEDESCLRSRCLSLTHARTQQTWMHKPSWTFSLADAALSSGERRGKRRKGRQNYLSFVVLYKWQERVLSFGSLVSKWTPCLRIFGQMSDRAEWFIFLFFLFFAF